VGVLAATGVVYGADDPAEQASSAWTNSTDLSLVMSRGNSTVQTLGLKNTLEHRSERGVSRFRIDALRSDTSDDPYYLVEPGLTFVPGETITGYTTRAVRPGPEPDVARYFAEGNHERKLPKNRTWNSGASWDRNEDAGILNRFIVFGGLGHVWRDREDLSFSTNYGLSFTDRQEDVPDPEKDRRFLGARLTSRFIDQWGKSTTYDNNFIFNISMKDLKDYNAELIQGVSVSMSQHLSLKISLQWLYASEPALEDVDVIARLQTIDPDGIPGNGDEYFTTVESGGSEITIGEDRLRKESLDTTFRTSLQITF